MFKKKLKKVNKAGIEEATKKPEEKKKRSVGEVRRAMYGKDK